MSNANQELTKKHDPESVWMDAEDFDDGTDTIAKGAKNDADPKAELVEEIGGGNDAKNVYDFRNYRQPIC